MSKSILLALTLLCAAVFAFAVQSNATAGGPSCEGTSNVCYTFIGPDGTSMSRPGVLTYKAEQLD